MFTKFGLFMKRKRSIYQIRKKKTISRNVAYMQYECTCNDPVRVRACGGDEVLVRGGHLSAEPERSWGLRQGQVHMIEYKIVKNIKK